MKKRFNILFIALICFMVPCVAAEISLSENYINNVAIKDTSIPAKVDITVSNNDFDSKRCFIDTLVDVNITPREYFTVPGDGQITVSRLVYPSDEIRSNINGAYSFSYYAKCNDDLAEKNMILKFLSMNEFVKIQMPLTIQSDAGSIDITFQLSQKAEDFSTQLEIDSPIMAYTKTITLSTANPVKITVPLKGSMPRAGVYEIKFKFKMGGQEAVAVKTVTLESKIILNEEVKKSGFFLNQVTEVTKINTGNSVNDATITISKDILSGMFTFFSEKATSTKKEGSQVIYEFKKELNPGEKLIVKATTSYYIPLLILILIAAGIWAYIVVTTPQVRVRKNAVRVRTKSGVFATKIILSAKNKGKEAVHDLKVIDRLPAFTELIKDKFGSIAPHEIRKNTLIWALPKLAAQEEMMFSYIVYSKLSVLGKLEIPN